MGTSTVVKSALPSLSVLQGGCSDQGHLSDGYTGFMQRHVNIHNIVQDVQT